MHAQCALISPAANCGHSPRCAAHACPPSIHATATVYWHHSYVHVCDPCSLCTSHTSQTNSTSSICPHHIRGCVDPPVRSSSPHAYVSGEELHVPPFNSKPWNIFQNRISNSHGALHPHPPHVPQRDSIPYCPPLLYTLFTRKGQASKRAQQLSVKHIINRNTHTHTHTYT